MTSKVKGVASTQIHGDDSTAVMIDRPSKVRRVSVEGRIPIDQDHDRTTLQDRINRSNRRVLKRRVTLDEGGFTPLSKQKKGDCPTATNNTQNATNHYLPKTALEGDCILDETKDDTFLNTTTTALEQQQDVHEEKARTITPHSSLLELSDAAIVSESASVTSSEDESDVIPTIKAIRSVASSIVNRAEDVPKSSPSVHKQRRFNARPFLWQLLVQIVLFAVYVCSKQRAARISFPNNDCIYVTGGGFSGFWFSLGRLRSLPDPRERNFVCYSAGCLGSVATLSNSSMEELYDIASTAREQFLSGERHRYDIVEFFVDGLLEGADSERLSESLDRLHILTSVTDPQSALPVARMQTPTDLRHLKTLLMQTTWIPQAIGSHFAHHGHLDGAFSAFQHPKCNDVIGLAWDFKLLANALNPNINSEMVENFWNMGLEYGV